MSYDLFFTGKQIAESDFASFFSGRPNYKIESSQAWYENEDTGVYFSFDFGGEEIEAEDGEEPINSFASFNLNFVRPSYFALEAEPEVNAFVSHFGCTIFDPQMDGMGSEAYSTDGFLTGWNKGNRFGYTTLLGPELEEGQFFTKSNAELEANWRWNFSKEQTYEKLGMDIFVPTVMYALQRGIIKSFIVWPDAIPTLIPKVDLILVPRQQLAPKRFLFGRKEDMCVLDPTELDSVLTGYEGGFHLPARNPRTEQLPKTIHDYVRGLTPGGDDEIEGVPSERVLNQEILEELRVSGNR